MVATHRALHRFVLSFSSDQTVSCARLLCCGAPPARSSHRNPHSQGPGQRYHTVWWTISSLLSRHEVHAVVRRFRRPRSNVHVQQDVRVGYRFSEVTQGDQQHCSLCNHRPWSPCGSHVVTGSTVLRDSPAYWSVRCWDCQTDLSSPAVPSSMPSHRSISTAIAGLVKSNAKEQSNVAKNLPLHAASRIFMTELTASTLRRPQQICDHPRFEPGGSCTVSESSTLPDTPQRSEYGDHEEPHHELGPPCLLWECGPARKTQTVLVLISQPLTILENPLQFCPTPPIGTRPPHLPTIDTCRSARLLSRLFLKLCIENCWPRLDFTGWTQGEEQSLPEIGHLRAWAIPILSPLASQGLENLSNVLGRTIITFIAYDRRALLAIEPSENVPTFSCALSTGMRSRQGMTRYLGRSRSTFLVLSSFSGNFSAASRFALGWCSFTPKAASSFSYPSAFRITRVSRLSPIGAAFTGISDVFLNGAADPFGLATRGFFPSRLHRGAAVTRAVSTSRQSS